MGIQSILYGKYFLKSAGKQEITIAKVVLFARQINFPTEVILKY
jgi:hypothetical protein